MLYCVLTHSITIQLAFEVQAQVQVLRLYFQTNTNKKGQSATVRLWILPAQPEKPDSKLQVYRFIVVPFGFCSSPFMLAAVLNLHLNKTSLPVANDMKQNIYVDNILSGCNTEAELIQYYTEAREIMGKAKFNLRSWSSNSCNLKRLVDEEETGNPKGYVGIHQLICCP